MSVGLAPVDPADRYTSIRSATVSDRPYSTSLVTVMLGDAGRSANVCPWARADANGVRSARHATRTERDRVMTKSLSAPGAGRQIHLMKLPSPGIRATGRGRRAAAKNSE